MLLSLNKVLRLPNFVKPKSVEIPMNNIREIQNRVKLHWSLIFMDNSIRRFFENSELLDFMVLKPLSHINLNWELIWNHSTQEFEREEGSFATLMNQLIVEFSCTSSPKRYHDNEDALAEYIKEKLNWPIFKKGNRWIGIDYESILTLGSFSDLDQNNLIKAAVGRIKAAIKFGQLHFDEMEDSHKNILAIVITIIIYQRLTKVDFEGDST